MIGVLIVDDDFRVAQVHTGFTEMVDGFRVVGRAHSAEEARARAAALKPDLVLLDVYLPDGSGLDLLSDLDADVIVLTAASDAASLRTALSRGALNYLIKPFTAADLADRLTAYARYRSQLRGMRLDQRQVDLALRTLRQGDRTAGDVPKGQSPATSRLVAETLQQASEPISAAAVAATLGISRATAQRYLVTLTDAGRATRSLRYGAAGRPEHLYTWRTR